MEEELDNYLKENNITTIFSDMIERILIERPENPIAFIVLYLLIQYPDKTSSLNLIQRDPSMPFPPIQASQIRSNLTEPLLSNTQNDLDIVNESEGRVQRDLFSIKEDSIHNSFDDVHDNGVNANSSSSGGDDSSTYPISLQQVGSQEFQNNKTDDETISSDEEGAGIATASSSTKDTKAGTKAGAKGRRISVSATPVNERKMIKTETKISKQTKTQDEYNELISCLGPQSTSSKAWLTSSLGKEELDHIISAMEKVSFNKGDDIIVEGNTTAEYFYILAKPSSTADIIEKNGIVAKNCKPGDGFGELALMYNSPRSATVKATSQPCEVWQLDRSTFKQIVIGASLKKREMYFQFLKQDVKSFSKLSDTQLLSIADCIQVKSLGKDEILLEQDRSTKENENVYIVFEGCCDELKDNVKVGEKKRGDVINSSKDDTKEGIYKTTIINSPENGKSSTTLLYVSKSSFDRISDEGDMRKS